MEIASWLSDNPGLEYAILDDDSDILKEQRPFFVQTDWAYGMQEVHANRLVELLSES